jgi:YkoP domain
MHPLGSSVSFPVERPRDHSWLRAALWALDARLRLRHGVREYTRSRECMFRIQVTRAAADLTLCDGTRLRAGDRIIDLHVWNEQFPRMAARGPTLGWAARINRSMELSLQELATHLTCQGLADIAAVRANMGTGPDEERRRFARFMARFGFEAMPAREPGSLAERMHRLGENVLVCAMVLARNPAAFRPSLLWRGRLEMYLSRRCLEERYGLPHRAKERPHGVGPQA